MYLLNFFYFNFFIFCIGFLGILLNRENLIIILLSIELILLSINLNFIFFSYYLDDIMGQIFSLMVLTVAASEAAIGLAIIIIYFRISGHININQINLLSL